MVYLLEPYDDALFEILKRGIKKADRTGVGCISVAGLQRKYQLDLQYLPSKAEVLSPGWHDLPQFYFPIVTGRRLFPKAVWAELLWFLSGSTLNSDLEALGCKFWGKWCDESNPKYVALREKWGYEPGDFGPVYGWALRHFGADYVRYRASIKEKRQIKTLYDRLKAAANREEFLAILEEDGALKKARGIREEYLQEAAVLNFYEILGKTDIAGGFDQLAYMVDILKNDPFGSNGRRCLFSLWNPDDLDKVALPPCHYTYQAIPDGDGGLTGILTQRSCDFGCGVPYNIIAYSALTMMLAQQAGLKAREFIHNTNDSHLYLNQLEAVEQYMAAPKPESPKIIIKPAVDIFSYKTDNFVLSDYNPGLRIDMPVSV